MREAGQLGRKHLVMFLFADFEPSPNADNNSVDNKCTFALARHDAETRSLIQAKMEMTGAYIDECAEAVKGQRQLPNAPHVSGVAVKFDDLAKPAAKRDAVNAKLAAADRQVNVGQDIMRLQSDVERYSEAAPTRSPDLDAVIARASATADRAPLALVPVTASPDPLSPSTPIPGAALALRTTF